MITRIKNNHSKIISDYLLKDKKLSDFYKYEIKIENFEQVILDKKSQVINREILVQVLEKQYSKIETSDAVKNNIASLKNENTFTICTAHQPCLFSGPLYFIYKIISAINLSEQLNKKFSTQHFVPIYWMGNEDHDFEEINHIHLFGKKLQWQTDQKGAVGRMTLDELKDVFDTLENILGEQDNAKQIIKQLKDAYSKKNTLSEATRAFVNEFMGKYGLIVIDGDEKVLKDKFVSVMQDEILNLSSSSIVEETILRLSKSYKVQVSPREINLFSLSDNARERIIVEDNVFKTVNELAKWSKDEILAEIKANPERFSPNVVLRPLYQETILPNLAYIGGGGELAYWLELKALFEHHKINYPMLLLRNSAMWIDETQQKKILQLGLSVDDFMLSEVELTEKYLNNKNAIEIDLSAEKLEISGVYQKLEQQSRDIDKSLLGFIQAEKAKQLNSIDKVEEKLKRGVKKQHEVDIDKIKHLKAKLFPNNAPQERYENIISLFYKHGFEVLDQLKESLNPFDSSLVIISK